MSAICAIRHADTRPVESRSIHDLLSRMAHAGPDAETGGGEGPAPVWCDGPVGLGFALLRDSNHLGTQPARHPSRDLTLTADVRIDNRGDLRETLGVARGHWALSSDAHLILLAYERWGRGCVERLIGDFAFILHDGERRELVAARDHLGHRALFYLRNPQTLVLASEVKALLPCLGGRPKLNEHAVADFLVSSQCDLGATIFEEIKRVPAAHVLVFSGTSVTARRYWDPAPLPELRLPSDDDYARALRDLIHESVSCRMPSGAPAAILLSGGLDSGVVAAVAARIAAGRGETVPVISTVLPEDHDGPERDERSFIQAMLDRHENLEPIFLTPGPHDPIGSLDELFRRVDQPSLDAFFDLTLGQLEAAAGLGTRILMTGEGGDYGPSFNAREVLGWMIRDGRFRELGGAVRSRAKASGWSPLRVLWREAIYEALSLRIRRLHQRVKGRRRGSVLEQFALDETFVERIGARSRWREQGYDLRDDPFEGRPLERMADGYRPENSSLVREAGGAMCTSFGVSASDPLFDKRIIDFCLSMPPGQLIAGGWRRSLLRRACDGIVPPEICWRLDKGYFAPSYHRRLAAETPTIEAILNEREARVDEIGPGFVDRDRIRRVLRNVGPCGPGSWSVEAQLVVGMGIMLDRFELWLRDSGVTDTGSESSVRSGFGR